MTNPYSKLGYLGYKKETTAGTAVEPNAFIELMSENIVATYPVTPVTQISTKRDVNLRPAKDKVEVSGDITVLVEAKKIGEFLQNFAGAPTTTTIEASKVYQHVWELANNNEVTYTFEVRPANADYAIRYVGVKITQLAFSQSDNKVQCVISIMAQKVFTNARATSALGNGTALSLDQTSGLTTTDIIRILDKTDGSTKDTASITSIDSEIALTLAENATASVGDIIVIDKQTASYTQSNVMTWIGGAKFLMKAKNDSGNPIDNVVVKEAEDFSINLLNDVEARYTAEGCNVANRFPTSLKTKGLTVNGNFKAIYTSSEKLDDMRSNEQVAIRHQFCGDQLDTNSAVAASADFGTGDAGFSVAATVAGETGSNINVRVIDNTADSLVASITGNNVLVKRASTTTASNTATLVAAAISALSGVISTASGSGASQVALMAKTNLTGGRDANEKELLQFDFPHTIFDPFNDNITENDLIEEDVNWNGYYDSTDSRTARITLRNNVSNY